MSGGLTFRFGRIATAATRLLNRGHTQRLAPRIMQRDSAAFTASPKIRALIDSRLGWTDVAGSMRQHLPDLITFRDDILTSGIKGVVVVGMGGSSLCPDLLGRIFGPCRGLKVFAVLDSTSPNTIKALERKIDYRNTLFVIASKSGTTIETRSHEAYIRARLQASGVQQPGRHLIAITDPGSELARHAKTHRYRRVFLNQADIGGRFSALSYFGIVPALFTGAPVDAMLESAMAMEQLLRERLDESNPALLLGGWMAACASVGADKLLFHTDRRLAPMTAWLEQLIAESLGKQGKGMVPVEGTLNRLPQRTANDRAFVEMTLSKKTATAFPSAPSPAVSIRLPSLADLGAQFLLWEAAVAVAGAMMKINPFDEPNVTESKTNTSALLARNLTSPAALFPVQADGKRITVLRTGTSRIVGKTSSVESELRAFFKSCRTPSYVAVLVFDDMTPQTEREIGRLRATIERTCGVATLRGYGPRYLHSIGQLYKGGPATGRFIIVVPASYPPLPIPGQTFGFGQLVLAQALGDAQALAKRRRPLLLVQSRQSIPSALRELANMIANLHRT